MSNSLKTAKIAPERLPWKICHISQSAGGVETYILNLLQHLSKQEFSQIVICHTNGSLKQRAQSAGSSAIDIPMVRGISVTKDLVSLLRIIKALKIARPDVIHAHSGKGGVLGRLAGFVLGIPVIFTPNGLSYLGQKGWERTFVRAFEIAMRHVPSTLVACSTSEAKRAVAEVGWPNDRVIDSFPNSLIVSEYSKSRSNRGFVKILTRGRLSYQKNPELFVEVAREVCRRNQNAQFVFRGAG